MSSNIIDMKDRLARTTSYIRECQARISKGEIMDLQGLDKNVGAMCEDIQKLPQEEARALAEKMEYLIQSLDELSQVIRGREKE